MKQKGLSYRKIADHSLWIWIGLGVIYWILASLIQILVFREGSLMEQILSPGSREIWTRSLVMFFLLLAGVFIQSIINRLGRTEGAMRRSEELLRATLESTADGILVVDEKGMATHTNGRFAELWRIPEELIEAKDDKKLLDFVLDQLEEPQAFLSKVQALYGTSKEDLDTLCFKDGRIFERFSHPLIQDGRIAGRVWSFRDITERRRAEKTLKESEKRFQDIAFSSADWIWEVDQNGRYTFVSGKVKRILGYDPSELLGKTPFDLMPEDEAKRIGEIFGKIISEKKPIEDLENWNLTKQGKKVCLLTSGVPVLDDSGNLLGYRGIDKDITDRKLAETQSKVSELS